MFKVHWGMLLPGLIMGLTGCRGTIDLVAHTPVTTRQVAFAPSATPSFTPVPSSTPMAKPTATATITPFPTVTPSVPFEPTKPVLIQYGYFGGDGGSDFDFYLGRDAPRFVLYSDGQLILKKNGLTAESMMFVETQLTAVEVCSLLDRIRQAGFFNDYTYDPDLFGDGPSKLIIQINGEPNKQVEVYPGALPYVTQEISTTYQILSDFLPGGELHPYHPAKVMLWLEQPAPSETDPMLVQAWPSEFAALTEIWQDPLRPTVWLEGQLAADILQLYDYEMKFLYFQDEGELYAVIARPILPHETSRRISPWPSASASVEVPLRCGESPAFLPTSTPAPTATPMPPTATPTLPPQAAKLTGLGRILFSSDRDGDDEIYVMDSDGANLVRLTNNPDSDIAPAWSPDRQRVAFSSDRDGNYEIYLMNADGTEQTRLTHHKANDWSPDWSPDGQRIVFASSDSNNASTLYITNTAGGELQYLTNGRSPAWSPDGRRIVYVSGRGDDSTIKMIDLERKNRTGLNNNNIAGITPAWSPDGQKIVFSSNSIGNDEIYLMNAAGTRPKRLTFNSVPDYSPNWSPNGVFIIFEQKEKICIIRADGTDLFCWPDSTAEGKSPDWAP